MSADNINTLVEVAIEVLERYAFMLGDPPGTKGGPAVLPEPSWIVTISFTGARAGGIGVVVSPGLARQAAANFYEDPQTEDGDEQAQDAVKELLNIVCGNYLHRVERNGRIVNLTTPSLQVATLEAATRYVNGKPQAMLAVEGHPLLLFVET
ncbi:MAG: chemotaxis protein CheX [Verrucomicrobia bacterium]|nr:chemotaxis protein CheX [Verrucomicrobiota bacterium]